MVINNVVINAELTDILIELQSQLRLNNIPLLHKMKETSDDWMVQCPYHSNGQERRPSAGIRKSDGLFHCFACGEVHSLCELISFCLGYSNDVLGKEGWKWLLKNFATVQVNRRNDIFIDYDRKNAKTSDFKLQNAIYNDDLEKYRFIHPYMYKRGLNDAVIEQFDIGYDKDTDSITFPVRDISGNTLFIARRNVKYKRFSYPKGVIKPLYGLYELYQSNVKASDSVFVTESMIDCILLWKNGHYAVAMNGVGSELQYKQLNDLSVRHLIVATDNDSAGRKSRAEIKKQVNKLLTYIDFPSNRKDIGECTDEEITNIRDWEVF